MMIRRAAARSLRPINDAGTLAVTMRSQVYGNGPLEIHRAGLSELIVSDNLTTTQVKRLSDVIGIGFGVDNLAVSISYVADIATRTKISPSPPTPSGCARMPGHWPRELPGS